eukprot:6510174-Prymnesium_polylepis.1
MRHASYTRKTWSPRYVPRGGVPFRNVTSTRRAQVSGPEGVRLKNATMEADHPAERLRVTPLLYGFVPDIRVRDMAG